MKNYKIILISILITLFISMPVFAKSQILSPELRNVTVEFDENGSRSLVISETEKLTMELPEVRL